MEGTPSGKAQGRRISGDTRRSCNTVSGHYAKFAAGAYFLRLFIAKYAAEIIIFLIACGFLLYNVTFFPPFGDELTYIHWGWVLKKGGPYFGYFDGVPPLFSYSISYFLKIFADPLQAGRIVSSISGIIGGIGIYIVSHKLYGRTAACTASLLYIFSPFTFLYHRMAMRESLMLANGVLILVFSVYFVLNESPKLNKVYLAGLVIGQSLSLLTKQHAGFFMAFPLIALALVYKTKAKLVLKLTAILTAYVATLLIFLMVLLFHENSVRMITFASELLARTPRSGLNGEIIVTSIYQYIGVPFIVLAIISLVKFSKEKRFFEVMLFVYPLLLLVMLLRPPWLDTRYVLTAILPWYVYAGAVTGLLTKNLKDGTSVIYKIASVLLVLTIFLPSIKFVKQYFSDPVKTPFTRYDRGFLESGHASYGLFDAFNFIKGLSNKLPIFIVTEPGSGPKNWPYMVFENNNNVKVEPWPGFRTTRLSPYLQESAYVILDDDPNDGGHYYFKKVNPDAKLIKRFWRPGRKAYVDIMLVEPARIK